MDRIPAILLTGPAGSGKTTLLNRLLRQPSMAGTLVVVAEFGATALDHCLVAHASTDAAGGLNAGCACCAVRADLAATLRDAPWRFSRGGRRGFERVVIEAGDATEPEPVLELFEAGWRVASRYRLDGVVAMGDAGLLVRDHEMAAPAERQLASADIVLANRSGGLDAAGLDRLARRLARLNPRAGPRWLPAETVDAGTFLAPLRPPAAAR